jgi:hypothetical protein
MRRIGSALIAGAAVLWGVFWALAIGVIVLWGFFLVFGAFTLADPVWLTLAMGVLVALAALHFAHVRKAIDDDQELARRMHMMRERRGF